MHAVFINSINDIHQTVWDAFWPKDYPFTQHCFLAALENTGCTIQESGWTPKHLIILKQEKPDLDQENILAVIPLYLKSHSYGEYVFDWSWADAYERNGFPYYPKLINAIPFTPATGPRLGFAQQLTVEQTHICMTFISETLIKQLETSHISSFHCLFPNKENHRHLTNINYLERQGCQYHWFNQNYESFDDFLSTFNSRKRKSLNKERKKVREENIQIRVRTAQEITTEEWQRFYHLYHHTYYKRSGRAGYLNLNFFHDIANSMPHQVLLMTAHRNTNDSPMIAAALYFRDKSTLYGRYWGALEDVDGLHFELCYYQGIEYAIEHGLLRFDPGAQGEHKIQRGFTPVLTSSFHKITHLGFEQAIAKFLDQEKQQNEQYCQEARTLLPFRSETEETPKTILIA